MKKTLFSLALGLLMAFGAQAAEVYTSYNSSTKTLTYYYDDNYGTPSRPNSERFRSSEGIVFRWKDYNTDVKKVVIDASMSKVSLSSMSGLFCGTVSYPLPAVESITGLGNLNTASVTDMSYMFYGLKTLKSIDLSNFNTAKVTTMSHMFEDCAALTSLDFSAFNTTAVKYMASMFSGCKALTTLDLKSFNTNNVEDMSFMFANCIVLTTLDIAKFRVKSLKNAEYMFANCPNLTTIYCNVNMSSSSTLTESTNMFSDCAKIKGEFGTRLVSTKLDKTYARPDKSGTSGYFTSEKVIYATTSQQGTIMAINYDADFALYNPIDWNADGVGADNMTTEAKEKITKVGFSPSMADARPTTCRAWFFGMKNVTEIQSMNYLNTSECTNMRAMFSGCNNLESLDVSELNTDKVKNMSAMFASCKKLTRINVSNFNTANVTTMMSMFSDCAALKSLYVSKFNTAKVTRMANMFNGCTALESITGISAFDISSLWSVEAMFMNCSSLKAIYTDIDWSASSKITSSTNMFSGCTSLTGFWGTAYDASYIDKSYARPDHGTNLPGYFTPLTKVYTVRIENTLYYRYDGSYSTISSNHELYDPIAQPNAARWKDYHDLITKVVIEESMKKAPLTSMRNMFYGGSESSIQYGLTNVETITGLEYLNMENVTNLRSMFNRCNALKSVNLSKFMTSKVTEMSYMFVNCKALTLLDLTKFDIGNVTTTEQMFAGCSALTTIKCDKNWSESNTLTTSTKMFNNCTSLIGGNGTAYNSEIIDATYARPDENGQKGYFTKTATGIEEIIAEQPANSAAQKVMIDGQIYILRDGKAYNLQGVKVK